MHDCHVYLGTTDQLAEHHHRLLSLEERRRMSRYRRLGDQQRFALGAVLLRCAVSRYTGDEPERVSIDRQCDVCRAPHGRPRIAGCALEVSVSHSDRLVAVAATTAGPVGVDVEAVARQEADSGILNLVASEPERTRMSDSAELLTLWTRKEAVLKALGTGLRLDPRSVSVYAPDLPPGMVSIAGSLHPCQLVDLDLGAAFRGATALLTTEQVRIAIRPADGVLPP